MKIVLYSVLAFWLLWVCYVFVMACKRVKDDGKLTRLAFLMALPVLIVGFALDIFLNCTLFTILCGELPKEKAVSERLKRYNENPNTWWWRKTVVRVFEPILDPFDPSGNHI